VDPALQGDLSIKDAIRRTFLYAFSLVWSRSRGSPDPVLVPLVELINGNSSRIKDVTGVNVEMITGGWPFIGDPGTWTIAIYHARPSRQSEYYQGDELRCVSRKWS
jgi:hypothetical protein